MENIDMDGDIIFPPIEEFVELIMDHFKLKNLMKHKKTKSQPEKICWLTKYLGQQNKQNTTTQSKKERKSETIDISVLTTDERMTMMKKGLCFNCGRQGHLARNCNGKLKKDDMSKSKKNDGEVYVFLQRLLKKEKGTPQKKKTLITKNKNNHQILLELFGMKTKE